MRLSEQQIKDAILDEDPIVRSAALRFFSESYSPDASVMPRAIEAIEKYGWDQVVHHYFHTLAHLALTEDSAAWLIDQLEGRPQSSDTRWIAYRTALVGTLAEADAEVLRPLRERILGLEALDEAARETIQTRLEFATASPEACWQELESLASQIVSSERQEFPHDQVQRAEAVASVLAPRAGEFSGRVLDLLAIQFKEAFEDPRLWLQGMMILLAGRMRLAEAAPLLVQRIYDDWDWYDQESADSLKRINGPPALEAIAAVYETAPWHVRLFGAGALEAIRTEGAVERLADMAAIERQWLAEGDDSSLILSNLCTALARQFDTAALPIARELIHEFSDDPEMPASLREVVAAYRMLGESTSELDEWRDEVERQFKRERQWYRQRPHLPLSQRKTIETPSIFDAAAAETTTSSLGEPAPVATAQPATRSSTRVGRNDPCPCGSGKKYKKCCMRKGGPHIDI